MSGVDLSVILGTVDRPERLRACVESIRAGLAGSPGFSYEIVVAYGAPGEVSLPWMVEQPDVRPILGWMDGAIPAFNSAYSASRGRFVAWINDDVTVRALSLSRALTYLSAHPETAAVAFRFNRRGDGLGLRHSTLNMGDSLPIRANQGVARRKSCDAIAAEIGGFWGDEQHRAHHTYGGDNAWSVIAWWLGLRVDLVPGVDCVDWSLQTEDGLRAANVASVAPDHSQRWRAIYNPYIEQGRARDRRAAALAKAHGGWRC